MTFSKDSHITITRTITALTHRDSQHTKTSRITTVFQSRTYRAAHTAECIMSSGIHPPAGGTHFLAWEKRESSSDPSTTTLDTVTAINFHQKIQSINKRLLGSCIDSNFKYLTSSGIHRRHSLRSVRNAGNSRVVRILELYSSTVTAVLL